MIDRTTSICQREAVDLTLERFFCWGAAAAFSLSVGFGSSAVAGQLATSNTSDSMPKDSMPKDMALRLPCGISIPLDPAASVRAITVLRSTQCHARTHLE